MKELVEKVAILIATGNNGGEWATHYTADQKDYWRGIAYTVIMMVQSTSTDGPF